MHQLECIDHVLRFDFCTSVDIDEEITSMKRKLGHTYNGSFGIANKEVHDSGKIAYDLECVVRKLLAELNNHEVWSVWRNDPMCLGSEPLAVAEPLRKKVELGGKKVTLISDTGEVENAD
jgi:hypothetical protein